MNMTHVDRNGLEVLDEDECLALLAQAHVGRVAVHSGALPAIFPVNYALTDHGIVFRTSQGSKLAAATQHAVVAFEIDEADSLYHSGWSVLAVGVASEISDPDALAEARALPLRAWGSTAADHFVRVEVDRMTGRRIDGAG
jgi:uncharacterized protein